MELAASGLTGHLEELDPENLCPDGGWQGGTVSPENVAGQPPRALVLSSFFQRWQ
jgi:hypothetical protein